MSGSMAKANVWVTISTQELLLRPLVSLSIVLSLLPFMLYT